MKSISVFKRKRFNSFELIILRILIMCLSFELVMWALERVDKLFISVGYLPVWQQLGISSGCALFNFGVLFILLYAILWRSFRVRIRNIDQSCSQHLQEINDVNLNTFDIIFCVLLAIFFAKFGHSVWFSSCWILILMFLVLVLIILLIDKYYRYCEK